MKTLHTKISFAQFIFCKTHQSLENSLIQLVTNSRKNNPAEKNVRVLVKVCCDSIFLGVGREGGGVAPALYDSNLKRYYLIVLKLTLNVDHFSPLIHDVFTCSNQSHGYLLKMYLWWSLCTLHLPACQVELP